MKPRAWLVALSCLFLLCGLVAACDTAADKPKKDRSDGQSALPEQPVDAGTDEPDRTRVQVDNSGPEISVSVRTPERRWSRSLAVTVNGRTTTLERDARLPRGKCVPTVEEAEASLITRLSFPRSCVPRSAQVNAEVVVDGQEPVSAQAKEAQTPNVLMIMVDDMRTDELKYMPNVQKHLADRGVTFTNGFSSLPLCCPARASVFTGQYPHNHGVWSHKPPWGFSAMKDKETFPVWIDRAGYRNAFIGKYLNRFGRDPWPTRKKGNSLDYVPPGWDQFHASLDNLPKGMGGVHRYFNTTLSDHGKGFISNKGTYQSVAFTEFEQDLLREAKKRKDPFFHYVSFSAPHTGGPSESDDPKDLGTPARPDRVKGIFDDVITEAPGADWHDPDQSDRPKPMQHKPLDDDMKKQMLNSARQRAESLFMVDKGIGKMIDTLEETGQLDNTMVVFTSDNGYFIGEQGIAEGKILPYEPSLRVPVIMRGPGIPDGERRTDPFLSVDFASTFADIADARVTNEVDGISMLDVARVGDASPGDSWSRMVPTETVPPKHVTDRLKKKTPLGLKTKQLLRGRVTGLRTRQYLYTEWAREPRTRKGDVRVELFDVLADPDQTRNLAVEPGNEKLLAQLHEVVDRARRCAGDSCRTPLPEELR